MDTPYPCRLPVRHAGYRRRDRYRDAARTASRPAFQDKTPIKCEVPGSSPVHALFQGQVTGIHYAGTEKTTFPRFPAYLHMKSDRPRSGCTAPRTSCTACRNRRSISYFALQAMLQGRSFSSHGGCQQHRGDVDGVRHAGIRRFFHRETHHTARNAKTPCLQHRA